MSMMRAGHCFRFGIQMITPNWAIIWRLMPPVASSIISLYRHFDPRIVQTSQQWIDDLAHRWSGQPIVVALQRTFARHFDDWKIVEQAKLLQHGAVSQSRAEITK